MSTEVATTSPTQIERGTVYTVTWRDGTDARTMARHTPLSGRHGGKDAAVAEDASWLMIGVRLQHFRQHLDQQESGTADKLEFSPWTDLADIADRFGELFGFPAHVGFDPEVVTSGAKLDVRGWEFGGRVVVVEAVTSAGVDVVVKPLAIGAGWVAMVSRMSPVERVLAIPARFASVIVANMLGSARRRTRSEALLVLAEDARAAYPSFASLLSQRRKSTGKSHLEAMALRCGELVGLEVALPCSSLFEFAEHGGQAAIAIAPEFAPH
jgi:hypothetical protein